MKEKDKTRLCQAVPVVALAIAWMACAGYVTGAGAQDAAVLLEKTDIQGGLCLVLGARDTALAADLAGRSALYVQVLQPDAKRAAAWGAAVASTTNRESLGIRNAAFDPAHFGSDLFNLVVVEDAGALEKAGLADLNRILVPNGIVALKRAPSAFAAEAKMLDMCILSVNGYEAAYRKPVKPVAWKLPLAQKWQAGPRSQIANGFNGVCNGDGKLFYLEQMERNAGDLNDSAAVLFARDAYNGRTLWTWEMPGRYGQHAGVGLVSTSKGRLFAKTGTGQLLCLDGNTGKALFEVASNVHRESRIWLLNDELLSIHGDVRSTETGKPLWKYPNQRYQPLPGTIIGTNIFFCDGTSIFAKKVATGEEFWKIAATNLPMPVHAGSLSRADDHLLVRMAGTKEEAAFALLDSATGKLLWTYTWKVRISESERYFDAGQVRFTTVEGKLLLYYRHNQPGVYPDEVVASRLDLVTGKPEFEDKINKDAGDLHGCFAELHLGDYIAYYDLWVSKKTWETSKPGMPHPACFFGSSSAFGLVFNFPSRKSGPITAVGPADFAMSSEPGGKTLLNFGPAPSAEATKPEDWPMFRGNPAGGNFTTATPGDKLVKAWEIPVGLGRESFGVKSSQRTGLTQPVSAYGLVVVGDLDGQRLVAVGAADGKQKWVFPVGSRVEFPPTLYNGLCLFAARDGWVYALNARTGALVWKRLVPAQERYVGGREKLESVQPPESDVRIVNGIASVQGATGAIIFNPETGEPLSGAKPAGRELQTQMSLVDLLIKGNSIPRTNEDNWPGFMRRNVAGRVVAFDETLTVAYQFQPAGEGWANKGMLSLQAVDTDPKKPLWKTAPIELVVDDIVLTPQHVYCVGHYQRIKKDPELWVLARADGKVLNTIPVDGFPAFLGMSAAGKRLFIATREGKLLCYRDKP